MDDNKFSYSYSAPTEKERREIEQIRNKYSEQNPKNSKLSRLKELDAKVRRIPMIVGILLGVFGTLVFGTGLTMILEWKQFLWGVIVMGAGGVSIVAAYFLHNALSSYYKDKHGKEILSLSEELLSDSPEFEDKE